MCSAINGFQLRFFIFNLQLRPLKTSTFLLSLLCATCFALAAKAFETVKVDEWSLTPMLEMRFGLQRGDNLNFGLGALDSLSEKERTNGELSLEPALAFERAGLGGTFFGKASVVA
ncbi:MAG: hypothetical protein ACI915_003806, partial [Gammaproteobacteria bacterium]